MKSAINPRIVLVMVFLGWTTNQTHAEISIMPMGDSITRGFQGSLSERGSYRLELERFFNFVDADVNFAGNQDFGRDGLIDKDVQAISGYRVEQMTADFQVFVGEHQPDFILVLAGTNNSNPATFPEAYDSLISMIQSESPGTHVIASTVPRFFCCRDVTKWTEAYVERRNNTILSHNAHIQSIAELKGITVVDLAAEIERGDTVVGDWVHLNKQGQTKLAHLYLQELLNFRRGVITPEMVTNVIQGYELVFDFDDSGDVEAQDDAIFISDYVGTSFGDANLDGQFNELDLILAFQGGQYERQFKKDATWATGDWNGDGEFTSNDLVLAIQTGAYEHGDSGSSPVVPEPTTASLAMLAMVLTLVRNRGRRQSC